MLKHDLERVLRQPIPFRMFKDSKQLFDVITRASHTTEKRLMIDVSFEHEACNAFEISNVGLVAGTVTPSDRRMKSKFCKQLSDLLVFGLDYTPVTQWIMLKTENKSLSYFKNMGL